MTEVLQYHALRHLLAAESGNLDQPGSQNRLADDRSHPLSRGAARIAQVDLVMLAAPLISLGRDVLVQPLDRRPFGGIRADMQNLRGAPFLEALQPYPC
jgi:hypothetical protein